MKPTTSEVVEGPGPIEGAMVRVVPAPDTEALHQQRIRFDGFFTGPTW
jgi:hypothetical protein